MKEKEITIKLELNSEARKAFTEAVAMANNVSADVRFTFQITKGDETKTLTMEYR